MNSRAANPGGSAVPVPPPPPYEFYLVLPDGSCIPATSKNCRIVMKQARGEARKQAKIKRHEKAVRIQMALEDRAAARRLMAELAELDRDLIRYAARFKVRVQPDKPTARTSPFEKRLTATPMKNPSLRPRGMNTTSSWVIDDRGMRRIIWQQSYLGRKSTGFYRGAARDNWEYDVRDEAVLLGPDGEPIIISNMGDDWVEIGAGWQAMEDASVRKNAKIQIRAIAPFDADMSREEMTDAVKHFCETVLEPLGLPYSAVIHRPSPDGDQRNFHPHIAFSLRPMRRVAPYTYEVADEVRGELDGKDGVQMLRHLWAHSMSAAAERAQSNRSYTGLGYGARGLDLEAGEHLGERRSAMLKRGETVWAHERNRIRNARNAARRAIRDADRKIEALTKVRDAVYADMVRKPEQRRLPRLVSATRTQREHDLLHASRAVGSQQTAKEQGSSARQSHAIRPSALHPSRTVAPRMTPLVASVRPVSPIGLSPAGLRSDRPEYLSPSSTPSGTSASSPRLHATMPPVSPDFLRSAFASVTSGNGEDPYARPLQSVAPGSAGSTIAIGELKAVRPRVDSAAKPLCSAASTPRSPTMPLAPSAHKVLNQFTVSSSAPAIEPRLGGSNNSPAILQRRQSPNSEVNKPRPLTAAPASGAINPFTTKLALMLDALAAARRARKRADEERRIAANAQTAEPHLADESPAAAHRGDHRHNIPQTDERASMSAEMRPRRKQTWRSRREPAGWSTRTQLEQRSWYEANPRTTFTDNAMGPIDPIDRRRLDRIRSLDLYVADYGGGAALTIDGEQAHALGATDGWLARPDIQRELATLHAEQANILAILSQTVDRRPLDCARHGTRFWPRYLDAETLQRLDHWARDDGFQRDVFKLELKIRSAHDKRDRASRAEQQSGARVDHSPDTPIPDGLEGPRDTPRSPVSGEPSAAKLVAFDRATGKPTKQLLMLLDLASRHPHRVAFAADGRLMAMPQAPALMAPLLLGLRHDDRVADLVAQTVRLSRERGKPAWPDSIAPDVRAYAARQAPAPGRAPVDWSSGRSR